MLYFFFWNRKYILWDIFVLLGVGFFFKEIIYIIGIKIKKEIRFICWKNFLNFVFDI